MTRRARTQPETPAKDVLSAMQDDPEKATRRSLVQICMLTVSSSRISVGSRTLSLFLSTILMSLTTFALCST